MDLHGSRVRKPELCELDVPNPYCEGELTELSQPHYF